MTKLRTLSLFSGIGGIELGLERTGGFSTVAFCEMDKHCHKVLNKHWPEVPIYDNILNFDASSLKGKVDVITGGWPCQGYSVAGKKKGMNDERSGLWKEVKRITQEVEPSWVVFENSANLRNLGLAEVLQDLWALGYSNIRWDVLPANAYGAVHRRERIWVVANRNGVRLSQEAFTPSQEESLRRAEAWADFSNRRCPEPRFYGVDDESPSKLDESRRKRRVAMCGNSVYNVIAEYIGRAILEAIK